MWSILGGLPISGSFSCPTPVAYKRVLKKCLSRFQCVLKRDLTTFPYTVNVLAACYTHFTTHWYRHTLCSTGNKIHTGNRGWFTAVNTFKHTGWINVFHPTHIHTGGILHTAHFKQQPNFPVLTEVCLEAVFMHACDVHMWHIYLNCLGLFYDYVENFQFLSLVMGDAVR